MPYYEKSEDWLHQSSLLLQARPATTRITTRYHIKPARRATKPTKTTADDGASDPTTTTPAAKQEEQDSKPPRGHLVLKTYDPESGVTLKYKTSKAAEVGRLVSMLGNLGRRMSGLPPDPSSAGAVDEEKGGNAAAAQSQDVEMVDASASGTQTPTTAAAAAVQEKQEKAAVNAGKGKKKKGKR
ncbi:signal recognition particle 9 kDa protein-domain-containing protein [Cladorrhinum samala]|uniref:Signal recognition particle 9 kDa protein-domain-containing protein n=1 Tax=Cladorrhinum samala TaxID=585594 RepID=A0AAV9I170_9PEZI|nr:signal recognition particle 9 kDa protein-domain-containing protein [Cladorrhinum samala]